MSNEKDANVTFSFGLGALAICLVLLYCFEKIALSTALWIFGGVFGAGLILGIIGIIIYWIMLR